MPKKSSRVDRFGWRAGDIEITGICNYCSHLRGDGGCDAFPFGIPRVIRNGDLDHRKPIEGDNGIQFEGELPETRTTP